MLVKRSMPPAELFEPLADALVRHVLGAMIAVVGSAEEAIAATSAGATPNQRNSR